MSSQQLEVLIMGQSYLLKCPEGGEAQFQAAVQKVDAAMCKIRDAGKIKARERIAVLAALNLAFEPASAKPADHTQAAWDDQADPEGKMRQLLNRLDQVLGDDGRLL
ncbi:MAG: cell division protein ZapA [Betaproteobacteria bacterium]|nr:cell division protein ZapA [Betaproteobacteria bacterium]